MIERTGDLNIDFYRGIPVRYWQAIDFECARLGITVPQLAEGLKAARPVYLASVMAGSWAVCDRSEATALVVSLGDDDE